MVQKTTIVEQKPNDHRKKSHAGLFVATVLAIMVLAAAGFFIFLNREKIFSHNSDSTSDASSSEQQKSQENESDKKDDKPSEAVDTREEGKDSVAQYEGSDPNTLDSITGIISFAGVSEGNFIVTATLDQFLSDISSCKFTITNNSGVTINFDGSASTGPSTSFCSYSSSASNIASGHYDIKVEISAGSKSGVITGEANI